MNEMELLRELAQETPLPDAAELDAARARLAAAIAAGSSQAAPLRPTAPAPVLSAVTLMHGGAVGTAAQLIVALLFIGDASAYHLTVLGHHLTTAQIGSLRPVIIALVAVAGLVVIALWLWMARAVRQGRHWARILSTVLFGLATLELTGNHGVAQVLLAMLTWLTGLAAVWQLWRPAAGAFFTRRRQAEKA